MQIHFERLTDTLYVRHEVYRSVVRSIFAAFPGDLSALAESDYLDQSCGLCLAQQEHTLALHNRRLEPVDRMTAVRALIANLPMVRNHVGAAGLAKDMSDDELSQYRPARK